MLNLLIVKNKWENLKIISQLKRLVVFNSDNVDLERTQAITGLT